MRRLGTVLLLLCLAGPIWAQSSLVPLRHPVYGWLLRQRVDGHLHTYTHETRPHDRARILGHLKSLETVAALSATDRKILREYLAEFDFERLRTRHLDGIFLTPDVAGSLRRVFANDREPALLAFSSADGDVDGAGFVHFGFSQVAYSAPEGPYSAFTAQYGGSGFLYSRSAGVGLMMEAEEIGIFGDKSVLERDPQWAYSWEYADPDNPSQSSKSVRYEGVLSWRSRFVDIDAGHGGLTLGPSVAEPLLIRPDAPDFTHLRMRLGTERVYITAIHGALYARPTFSDRLYEGDTIRVRTAPQRWVAMHRLTLLPLPNLALSLFESVGYANRGLDPNYLNPLVPYLFLEMDLGDRDNNLAGMDMVWRPRPGTELMASLLIDDLSDIGSLVSSDSTKVGLDIGWRQSLPGGLLLSLGYTRLDAYLYTHWMRLNAIEHRDQPLGPAIGPNAETYTVRLDGELPRRTRYQVGYTFGRKGMNRFPDGGGDIRDQRIIIGIPLYADADVQAWHGLEVDVRTQPLRGWEVGAQWKARRMVRGDRWGDEDWFRVMLVFGF
jgi:hypothetical protein